MERQFEDYKAIVNKHLLDFIPVIDNKSISLYDAMKYSLTASTLILSYMTIFPPWTTTT